MGNGEPPRPKGGWGKGLGHYQLPITYYPLPILDRTSSFTPKAISLYFFNIFPENISFFRSIEVDYIYKFYFTDIQWNKY